MIYCTGIEPIVCHPYINGTDTVIPCREEHIRGQNPNRDSEITHTPSHIGARDKSINLILVCLPHIVRGNCILNNRPVPVYYMSVRLPLGPPAMPPLF